MMKLIVFAVALICISGQVYALGFGGGFQSNICHVKDGDEAATKCESGDVILFQPSSFGNVQLPIIISSAFCDYEHPIVYNEGGVSCIFTDVRKNNWGDFGIKSAK